MVKIEYSTNSRARCQSCHSNIGQSTIRIAVKAMSPYQKGDYITKYHHASCYSNRKDFTKFYGFWDLAKDDKKQFMNEEQLRENFPEDYMEETIIAATTTTTQCNATQEEKSMTESSLNLTITGIKYGEVCAYANQKVLLVREPENKYDKNAIKVTNLAGQLIGRIKKEQAVGLSSKLVELDCICTVIDNGDGWNQKLKCVFEKKTAMADVSATETTTASASTDTTASATVTALNKSAGKQKRAPSTDIDPINATKVCDVIARTTTHAKKKVPEVTPSKKSPIAVFNPYLKINSTKATTKVDVVTPAKQVPEITPSKKIPIVVVNNPYLKTSSTNATKVGDDVTTAKNVPEITPSKKRPIVTVNNPYLKINSTNTTTNVGDVTDKRPPELSKKRPIVVNTYLKVLILTVTGIKYAQVCAYANQKVLLVREPENIHDENSIKVTNLAGQMIGHIKRQQAFTLSSRLAKLDDSFTTDCMLIDNGDGYNQKLKCVFKKKDTKKVCDQSPSTSASASASTTISSSATAVITAIRKIPEVTPSKPIIANPYLNK